MVCTLCLSAQAVCLSAYLKCCSHLCVMFTHRQQWQYSDASHFIYSASSVPLLFAIFRNQVSVRQHNCLRKLCRVSPVVKHCSKEAERYSNNMAIFRLVLQSWDKTCVVKRLFLVAVIENIWALEGVTVGWRIWHNADFPLYCSPDIMVIRTSNVSCRSYGSIEKYTEFYFSRDLSRCVT
jgi:hypothetical protein